MTGLEVAQKRGRRGGLKKIDAEKWESILRALKAGRSKVSICRTFQIPRTTLYDYIGRSGAKMDDSLDQMLG